MAAESLLVAVAGDPDDHRVLVLPVGEERQARRFPTQLVFRVVQIGEVLDFRDWQEAGYCGARGDAEDRLLIEDRVEYPRRTHTLCQSPRHSIHAALACHVLTEDKGLRIVRQ